MSTPKATPITAMVTATGRLTGVTVLVTRPAHQSAPLCALIAAEGARALSLPAIEILPPQDPTPAAALFATLPQYDLVIFVSANAVTYGLALLHSPWPPALKIAAVGARTAAALQTAGLTVDVSAPPPHNSEALLDTAALYGLAGKRVLIVRGEGGRELLADTLRARGAHVDYAQVYRRARPAPVADEIRLEQLSPETVDVVVVTSNEGLRNLAEMARDAQAAWVMQRPLVVIGRRAVSVAREQGYTQTPYIADEASDAGLLAALISWRSHTTTLLVEA